jgi:hypothetical protein
MMTNFPDELTCDMAETYGIFDIKRVPVKLLATLAVGLRDDSRVMMAKRGALVDTKTILLAKLLDMLSGTETNSAQSLTAKCFVEQPTGSTTAPHEKYEIFDSPEAYKKRWTEVTRN